MNLEQFSKHLIAQRKKIKFGQKTRFTPSEREEFAKVATGMCERIFDGRKNITVNDYKAFRNQMQELLWHYEFEEFEQDAHHHISVFDVTQSFFVWYIPFQKIDQYISHLRGYGEYKKQCCSCQQYIAF